MKNRTVCILTSGKGSRMGSYAGTINKALLPLQHKAVISHIVGRFPEGTEFVIGLGHLGTQVRQYLSMAHPQTVFHFVTVPVFEGPGSGPGHSLLSCRPFLQKEFYFVSCDTLWKTEIDWNRDGNWFAVAGISRQVSQDYCNLRIENGRITGIKDKEQPDSGDYKAFTGLCFIKDHEAFFKGLEKPSLVAGEQQISDGISALLRGPGCSAMEVDWLDVGDESKYRAAVAASENFDFSKSDEFLYIFGGRVIKFFHDHAVARRRAQRAGWKPGAFPAIEAQEGQFYAYRFLEGNTLYQHNDPVIFKKLLRWLKEEFWSPVQVGREKVSSVCRKFYREKTMRRLELYARKYDVTDGPSRVNGLDVPPTSRLLEGVPWDKLYEGKAVFIHGDLQFDNILYDPGRDKFTLLDWRQDFAGEMEWGDLYYDLAKMLGGIILNYDLIKMNLFWYREEREGVIIDFARRFSGDEYARLLSDFCAAQGWDIQKLRFLVGLIYLNMSPLHHAPFDKMLYSLGRYMLFTANS